MQFKRLNKSVFIDLNMGVATQQLLPFGQNIYGFDTKSMLKTKDKRWQIIFGGPPFHQVHTTVIQPTWAKHCEGGAKPGIRDGTQQL